MKQPRKIVDGGDGLAASGSWRDAADMLKHRVGETLESFERRRRRRARIAALCRIAGVTKIILRVAHYLSYDQYWVVSVRRQMGEHAQGYGFHGHHPTPQLTFKPFHFRPSYRLNLRGDDSAFVPRIWGGEQ